MNKFKSVSEILELAQSENKSLVEVITQASCEEMNIDEKTFRHLMHGNLIAMKTSITNGQQINEKSNSGLVGDLTKKMHEFNKTTMLFGDLFSKVVEYALAVSELNACMGCIVAAPTAGSCGIIPALLFPLQEQFNFSDEQLVDALICASAIGFIIATNASVAGATGGCQAECGSASCMGACAVALLLGATNEQISWAGAHALKSFLGLVCDPVAGLVEEPCIVRNVSSAVVALSSAQLALANINSIIPLDEVIYTMKEIGDNMDPIYKETAMGGLATTKTGCKINKKIYN